MYTKAELIVCILIIIIIDLVLLSVWLFTATANEEFFSHFSFASTVTSIILSILAIFMSVIGESRTQHISDKIEQEERKLAEITERFDVNIKDLMNKTEMIVKNTDSIKAVVNENPGQLQITDGRADG